MLSRAAGLLEAEVDGELIGLHVENGTCYGFNRTASLVWSMLEQPRRFGELVDELAASHHVDWDRCAAEVESLLRDLAEDGLVLIVDPGAQA
ncbi:MAG: PqqD family protein [Allosphingosinicella sp.]|uniref:PqqD family protein n=1 Tax=Allosphingosinicella sp. TaxID=2823234 RepID=UPI003927F384